MKMQMGINLKEVLRVLKLFKDGTEPPPEKEPAFLTGWYQGQQPLIDQIRRLIRDVEKKLEE